jgi:hypothetical protein
MGIASLLRVSTTVTWGGEVAAAPVPSGGRARGGDVRGAVALRLPELTTRVPAEEDVGGDEPGDVREQGWVGVAVDGELAH